MTKSYTFYVVSILEACERIQGYAPLLNDDSERSVVKSAVLFNLSGLLQRVETLPDDLKQSHSLVNWPKMLVMKVKVDDYLNEISKEDFLEFLHTDLPPLQAAMEEQLPDWKALRTRMQDD